MAGESATAAATNAASSVVSTIKNNFWMITGGLAIVAVIGMAFAPPAAAGVLSAKSITAGLGNAAGQLQTAFTSATGYGATKAAAAPMMAKATASAPIAKAAALKVPAAVAAPVVPTVPAPIAAPVAPPVFDAGAPNLGLVT